MFMLLVCVDPTLGSEARVFWVLMSLQNRNRNYSPNVPSLVISALVTKEELTVA